MTTEQADRTVTRLGTPTAFLMLVGLFLVYYALRGWDSKYGTFSGAFAGPGSIPTGTRVRAAATSATSTVATASPNAITTNATTPPNYSSAIATLDKYISNLEAVRNPSVAQRAELQLYRDRRATYLARQPGAASFV